MTYLDQLAAATTQLERAHEATKARLTKQMIGSDPYEVVDHTGRPVLLDSLTAIVNARAVLARCDAG